MFKYAFRFAPGYYTFYVISMSILEASSSVSMVLLFKYMIDSVSKHRDFGMTMKTLALFGAVLGLSVILLTALVRINEAKALSISGKVQREIIKKAADIDMICYDKSEFYDEFVRAAEKGEAQISSCINIIIEVIAALTSIAGIITVILSIDPVVAIFPFLACFVNFATLMWINKVKYDISLETDPVNRKKYYSRRVFYQPEYSKEMKLTDIGQPLFDQFQKAVEDERAIIKKRGLKLTLVSLSNYIVGWTACLYYLPPLYMIYKTMVKQTMKVSDLAAMHNANTETFYNMNSITWQMIELQKIGLYTENFRRFMDYEIKIENTTGRSLNNQKPQTIEINNLSFQYDESSSKVLEEINLTIQPGEKIAIVGHNGAGKSTFIKLLLRLYDPTEGSITYGGHNIKEYDINGYRQAFGTVFQDFQIFAGTVGENIMMDYVTPSDRLLIDEALKLTDMSEKINQLKLGIDTQLTREFDEDGTVFSGGESQKIAISRIFAKEFAVAILDEPSSALDPIAEYNLNHIMLEAARENTVIFISHRLSTTRMADRIYMFEKGKIIEAGTHDELMNMNGEYAKMFRLQAHYYEQ